MKKGTLFIKIGRLFSILSLIAFMLTWITSFTGGNILGRTEEHLFFDAIILALLSIICLLDGFLHSKDL
jgi:Mg2+ and Co2+ transporter CorA